MAKPKSRHTRVYLSIVLIIVLIGGGVGVASLLYAMREEAPMRDLTTPAPVVDSFVLEAETVTEVYMGYGSAQSVRVADLAAEVPARVVELVDDIRAGSIVAEGQPLVRLDDREYRRNLDRAVALAAADQASLDELAVEKSKLQELMETATDELRIARDEYLRVADLHERELAAKKEYDFANLAWQQARRVLQGYEMEEAKMAPRMAGLAASKRARLADAELAKLNIERCEIKAPFAGRIRTMLVEIGELVGPGTVLMTLVDPSLVEIAVQLPAATYDLVRVDAPCRVQAESLPGAVWSGQVARIAPNADETTRTFAAYVIVDNTRQEQPLVPGMFVKAEVEGPTHKDRLLVARGAIRDGHVLVVDGGVARRRAVSVERLIGERAIVSGKINRGDRVILSHLSQLDDGSGVRISTTNGGRRTADSG
jgi:multidrug efflux pump subunit AcrA (membrane-fusion protein)